MARFHPFVTIWAFLSQILDAEKSCHNAVSRVIAWLSTYNVELPSTDTSASLTKLGGTETDTAHFGLCSDVVFFYHRDAEDTESKRNKPQSLPKGRSEGTQRKGRRQFLSL